MPKFNAVMPIELIDFHREFRKKGKPPIPNPYLEKLRKKLKAKKETRNFSENMLEIDGRLFINITV